MHIPIRFTQHSRLHTVVFLTLILFLMGRTTAIRTRLDQVYFSYQINFARFITQPLQKITITPQFFQPLALMTENAKLRQQVRTLEIQGSIQQEEIRRLMQLGNSAAQILGRENKEYLPALLTKSASTWMVSVGRTDGVTKHSPLFISGGYIGYILEPMENTSTVWTWMESGSRIGVLHQKSRVLGVMQTQKDGMLVEFFARVEGIEKNDILLTVGDSPGIPVAVPIATVVDSITKDSDSITRVKAKALAPFSPGDIVQIEKK